MSWALRNGPAIPESSVATPAEPGGEKKLFVCANFGR